MRNNLIHILRRIFFLSYSSSDSHHFLSILRKTRDSIRRETSLLTDRSVTEFRWYHAKCVWRNPINVINNKHQIPVAVGLFVIALMPFDRRGEPWCHNLTFNVTDKHLNFSAPRIHTQSDQLPLYGCECVCMQNVITQVGDNDLTKRNRNRIAAYLPRHNGNNSTTCWR